MSDHSKISWTDTTWNVTTGCNKVSAGCLNCYAEKMTRRLQAMGQAKYRDGFDVVRTHEAELDRPKRWRKPRMVFVCSMSDLFHRDVPDAFIRRVFDVMVDAPHHTFQVLTKRSDRMAQLAPSLPWPRNVWAGVTVEADEWEHRRRITHLGRVPAVVRFLSMEPLLGPVESLEGNLAGYGIHWVIVGGESGTKARPMAMTWARGVRDACQLADVPFFFKQWGGVNKRVTGRVLDGRTWDEMPDSA